MAQIPLKTHWKARIADNIAFKTPTFTDTDWADTDSPQWKKLLDEAETPEGQLVVLWARNSTVSIPKSMQAKAQRLGFLLADLGPINNQDEVYFNGTSIGKTNVRSNVRRYLIPVGLIRFNAPNTLAIRLANNRKTLGFFPESVAIRYPAMPDLVSLSPSVSYPRTAPIDPKKPFPITLQLVNKSKQALPVQLVSTVSGLADASPQTLTKQLVLKPGNNTLTYNHLGGREAVKLNLNATSTQLDSVTERNLIRGYADIAYTSQMPVVAYSVPETFVPNPYENDQFGGYTQTRLNLNIEKRLLQVDEEGLLAGYINRPGIHPWIGEHAGKFLEAACLMYRLAPSPALKARIDRTAQTLLLAQLPDGYLGTYTPNQYWSSWDVWSHKYNLVGLLNYYALSGYKPALTAAQKIGDLLARTFGDTAHRRDIIASGTHVGMAATSVIDPMVDLYRFTGNPAYLAFCQYILRSYEQPNGPKIISTLLREGKVNRVANAKAYEMLSNLVGITKLYKVTQTDSLLQAIRLAWQDIVANRLYVTGATSSFERFQETGHLPAGNDDHIGEGCVSTTWIQLNLELLKLTGDEKYAAELEKTAYNQLLGAENPQSGCVSYYTALQGVKPFSCHITCCLSSVPRGISLMPQFAVGMLQGQPALLTYQPGRYRLVLPSKEVVNLNVETTFPETGDVTIRLENAPTAAYTLLLRVPDWSENFTATAGSGTYNKPQNGYLAIPQSGQTPTPIRIRFEMPVKTLTGGQSYPDYVGFKRGPLVLSFDEKLNTLKSDAVRISPQAVFTAAKPQQLVPDWVGSRMYETSQTINGKPETIRLVPFADAGQKDTDSQVWLKKQ